MKKRHNPTVYIIIPLFNRLHFTKECLSSIKAQAYKNIVTIVVDSGSTDGTYEYIKENYPNIKIIFGGSHPSLDTSILKESFIDFLAIGEGEITLTELLNNRPLKEINGLA